jgi:tetratricopeptide (TPR) repeat protein
MVAGRLFAQGGNYRQAIQNFLRAKELDPSLRQADLMTGAAFLVSGYPDRALRVVEQIHADRNEFWQGVTNQVEVARLEALCHFAQTNRQAAEAVLQRLLEKHYTNDFALSSVAYVYLSHGFYSNALAILSVQLKQKPDSAQALLNQAVCYMNLGQHNLAVESLNRYLALKPNDFAGLMNRAISLVQLGRLEEARKDYLKVISINADYYPAHYGLGEIAYRQNDKKKAIQHYQAYLKNAPEHLNERKTVQERLKQLQAG